MPNIRRTKKKNIGKRRKTKKQRLVLISIKKRRKRFRMRKTDWPKSLHLNKRKPKNRSKLLKSRLQKPSKRQRLHLPPQWTRYLKKRPFTRSWKACLREQMS